MLCDLDKFTRKMLWREYFASSPQEEIKNPPMIKTEKINLPMNHKTPQKLERFLNAATSDLLDSDNRNKVFNNLPVDEQTALKELMDLQRNRVITIKPADKGAGIVILEFEDYMQSWKTSYNPNRNNLMGLIKAIMSKFMTIFLKLPKILLNFLSRKDMIMNIYVRMNMKPLTHPTREPLDFTKILKYTNSIHQEVSHQQDQSFVETARLLKIYPDTSITISNIL